VPTFSTFPVDNFVGKQVVMAPSAMPGAIFIALLDFCAVKNIYESTVYDNISVA
jgi:hypothetical protein